MICLTGAEGSVAALSRRLADHDQALHEVRIDALEQVDDELFDLVERHAARLLICCRPRHQGGRWQGGQADRIQLLRRAHDAGARFIDVEADVEHASLRGLEPARLLLSWHDHAGFPTDAEARLADLRGRQPGAVKLAVTVSDAAELARLLDLRDEQGPATLLIGMGPAGLLSRTHYPAFGSPWCYVASSAPLVTAPGQLDLASAQAFGLPESARWPLLALVGGEQVLTSPGPRAYRRLFSRLGVELGYVPVICRSLRTVLPLLERLGAQGLSVTMPLKTEALTLGRADEQAERVGAANTLRRDAGGWRSFNTDVSGVREPLRTLNVHGRALILGAGGAARAAALACADLGLGLAMAARRPQHVTAWLDAAGLPAEVIPWAARAEARADLLVNATPLGGDECPWPEQAPLPPAVFDLALGGGQASALLRRAHAEGRGCLGPLSMWVAQGAAQMSLLLRRPVTQALLQEALA